MATISGYDSSSISSLFSGLSTNNNNSSSSNFLGISLTDYSSIRSGSYYKLMKNYYAEEVESKISSSTSTSKDSAKTLAQIETAAEDLKSSTDALLEKGTKSLFKKKEITDDKGNTTIGYDTDAIYKAVKEFADDYNSMIDKADDSNVTGILNATSSMVRGTKANSSMLSKIGITIGADNKLSVDETAFKKADMGTVKSMFNTQGSYGYQVSTQASMANYYAENEASKSNTYGNKGMYTYNYSTGEIYNTTT